MTPLAFPFTQDQLEVLLNDEVLDAVVAQADETGEEIRDEIQLRCSLASANPIAGRAVVKLDDYTALVVNALRQTNHDELANELAKWHGLA